jgi:hypothetical protein
VDANVSTLRKHADVPHVCLQTNIHAFMLSNEPLEHRLVLVRFPSLDLTWWAIMCNDITSTRGFLKNMHREDEAEQRSVYLFSPVNSDSWVSGRGAVTTFCYMAFLSYVRLRISKRGIPSFSELLLLDPSHPTRLGICTSLKEHVLLGQRIALLEIIVKQTEAYDRAVEVNAPGNRLAQFDDDLNKLPLRRHIFTGIPEPNVTTGLSEQVLRMSESVREATESMHRVSMLNAVLALSTSPRFHPGRGACHLTPDEVNAICKLRGLC